MIGILCSNKKEKFYIERLHSLFKPYISKKNPSIMLFTLPGVNLQNKTVNGHIICDNKIITGINEIPSIIYNLSFQHRKSYIKKLRNLNELEHVLLINEVNQYNQWMIMEMLFTSDYLRQYVLPCKTLTRNNQDKSMLKFDEKNTFIFMPQSGSNISKIVYVKQQGNFIELYHNKKIQSFDKNLIHSTLNPILLKNSWMLINTPELALFQNQPIIYRYYFQKGHYGKWYILTSKIMNIDNKYDTNRFFTKYQNIAISMLTCAENYIPNLGNCYIDLIFDVNYNPYFIHLGGWDEFILGEKCSEYIKSCFARNMLNYAIYCLEMAKGD